MQQRAPRRQPGAGSPDAERVRKTAAGPAPQPGLGGQLLGLQSAAGNRAVSRLVQREGDEGASWWDKAVGNYKKQNDIKDDPNQSTWDKYEQWNNAATGRTQAHKAINDLEGAMDKGNAASKKAGDAWIDEQLDWASVDASAVEDAVLAGLPTLSMTANVLSQLTPRTFHFPDVLNSAMFYRQTFSPRQLHEVMVDFWSDHFSIYQLQEGVEWYKAIDDREVIRPHALGRFKDLLSASAHSPAMLIYLNNIENLKGKPNENYAREIMELHTLGVAVDGVPYTEDDIKEVARCFTGWNWVRQGNGARGVVGDFQYRDEIHDQNAKKVLGTAIPARHRRKRRMPNVTSSGAHRA